MYANIKAPMQSVFYLSRAIDFHQQSIVMSREKLNVECKHIPAQV